MALALTIPMILLSGPVVGFLLGNLWLKHFGGGPKTVPFAVVLGFLLSGFQSFRLIYRVHQLNRGASAPAKKDSAQA